MAGKADKRDWLDIFTDPAGGAAVVKGSLLAGSIVFAAPAVESAAPAPPGEADRADEATPEEGGPADGQAPSDQEPAEDLKLPRDHIARAHKYLTECWLSADGRSSELLVIGQLFYRYDRGTGCWSKVDPEGLVGDILRWSSVLRRAKVKEKKDVVITRWAAAAMSNKEARDVLDSVRYELMVDLEGSRNDKGQIQPGRFWMRGTQAAAQRYRGGPVPAARPWERVCADPEAESLPIATMLLPLADGLLDLGAWDRGEIVRLPHTTRLFNLNRYPYELPWGELQEAAKEAEREADQRVLDGAEEAAPGERERCRLEAFAERVKAISQAMAPAFWSFLDSALGRDPVLGVPWASEDQRRDAEVLCGRAYEENMRELAKFGGYLLGCDVEHHKGNVVVLHGPPGSGKGTVQRVFQRVLGPDNSLSLSIEYMGRQEYLHACMGKALVVLPDERPTDLQVAREGANNIKKIAGGDAVSFRALFNAPVTNVQLYCRFLLGVNEMPNLADEALVRRMIVIDFARVPDRPNLGLDAALGTPEARLGQLLWMLLGRLWLRHDGRFIQPESSRAPLEIYEQEADKYGEFVEQCLTIWTPATGEDPDSKPWRVRPADVAELYAAYAQAEHGHTRTPTTDRVMAGVLPAIRRRFPQSQHHVRRVQPNDGGVRYWAWAGIKLAKRVEDYLPDEGSAPIATPLQYRTPVD